MPRKSSVDKMPMTVWVSRSLVETADRLAEKADISRSKLCENLLEVGIEELSKCEKVGIFQLSLLLRDMQEGLKAWAESVNRGPDVVGDQPLRRD